MLAVSGARSFLCCAYSFVAVVSRLTVLIRCPERILLRLKGKIHIADYIAYALLGHKHTLTHITVND